MKNTLTDTRSIYLTTGQAAQQLGISRRTLERAVDRGEIARVRQTPGGWSLFLATDVDAFAQRLSAPVPATPQRPSPLTRREGDSHTRGHARVRVPCRAAVQGGGVAVLEDSSARTGAAEALRQSEECFRLLVSSVRDCALYVLDPQGRVAIWNDGAQRLKGYTASEIVGQHVSIFYTPEDRAQGVPAEILRRAAAQGHDEVEGWRVRNDGSRFWAEVCVTAMYDAQGDLIGFGKVTRDLTELRRVDNEIRALNASLEQRVAARTADLATANRHLRAINEELEAFAYSVSHDLRTPLRAISGFGEVLLTSYHESLDARGRHYLERIHAATTQMGQLIDDLLALSRLARAEMRTTPVDLTGLAREVVAALQQTEPERAVTWDIAEGLTAHGDASLLRVVLDNLLGNAWKFTSRHPTARIAVGMRQEGGEVIYVVRDDGAGFDMTYADKLFGAFQRLHTVHEFAGTGIGLATVQRIIHRHGGRVWAEGAVEQGATISFTLAPPEGGRHAAHG